MSETILTLVEISEREVIAAAKAWCADVLSRLQVGDVITGAEIELSGAVVLLEERERMATEMSPKGDSEPMPPHLLGARPITRRFGKLSRRAQEIEKRKRSDPLASERDDIDYGSDELPSVR